jgi:hypothetical protein
MILIYRLILAAVLLASKFYNDVYYGNQHVGFVGGVDLNEINILEKEFLIFIDWSLWVDPAEYNFYLQGLL